MRTFRAVLAAVATTLVLGSSAPALALPGPVDAADREPAGAPSASDDGPLTAGPERRRGARISPLRRKTYRNRLIRAGVPARAATSYLAAWEEAPRSCELRLEVVAAVGDVRSGHGEAEGRRLLPDGRVLPPLRTADLAGPTDLPDTDDGFRDGSADHDGPFGPMGVTPTQWERAGLSQPHRLDDAARALARALCDQVDAGGLGTRDGEVAALRRAVVGAPVARLLRVAERYGRVLHGDRYPELAEGRGLRPAPLPVEAGPTPDVVTVGGITVAAEVGDQLAALLAHARADGIELEGSGWRSPDRQRELRRVNGCPDVDASPPSACDVPTAIPGTSRHEQGLAIDFAWEGGALCFPLGADACRGTNAAFDWLDEHAASYGFEVLPSEAWHWSTDGR